MSENPAKNIATRLNPEQVRAWLDRLDAQAPGGRGIDLRASDRVRYRPAPLSVEFLQGDGTGLSCAAFGRNLSREGMSLVVGRFVYARTPCRVTLRGPQGREDVVTGRVARCRYVEGSGHLYDVGVEFDHPLDITVFAPDARTVRVLLIDSSTATQELAASLLRPMRATVSCVALPENAGLVEATRNADLIMIDLDSRSFDAFETIREVRACGFVGPVIGMTVNTAPGTRARCAASGCTGYLSKPILRRDLQELVDSLRDPPLISSLAHDVDLAPLVERFVNSLRQKVAQMGFAFERGDAENLEVLVCGLRAEAGSYGFEAISEEAAYVQSLLIANEPRECVRPAMQHLMHLCLKARSGTAALETFMPARRAAQPRVGAR